MPGLMTPGHLATMGTRKPPSYTVPFSPRNGWLPPSGQLKIFRAVVAGKHHDRVVGDAKLVHLGEQLAHDPVQLGHRIGKQAEAGLAVPLLDRCVKE